METDIIIGRAADRTVTIGGRELDPAPSQKIRNHSPDGFAWGYGGSGPAQLALAILLEVADIESATRLYHDFKFEVLATFPMDRDFELPVAHVHSWVKRARGI